MLHTVGLARAVEQPRSHRTQAIFHRKSELSLEGDIILWGNGVVTPSCFQTRLLEALHASYIGI